MKIIGINAFHADSSACILVDGKLIAAVEEERFNRIKHWAGFPIKSIKHCLNETKLKISDIDQISINIDPRANIFEKFTFFILMTLPRIVTLSSFLHWYIFFKSV